MKKCKIYFTSDTHGFLFPTGYADLEEKDMGLLKAISGFEIDGNTLVCDGGDSIVGSPFTFFHREHLQKVHPVAQVMNAGGYQFITLGNHDFNYGLIYLENYLSSLDAVCVCANIRDKERKLPIQDWAIATLENGLKVGITGVCTDFVKVWEKKETLDMLEIEDPVEAARQALLEMKDFVDLTICIYHGGIEKDLETEVKMSDSKENLACLLAEELDFDLILTGHQHKSYEGSCYHGTYLVQPTDKAKEFVKCEIELEDDKKVITSQLITVDFKVNEEVRKQLLPLEEAVQKWLDTPKGKLNIPLLPKEHLDAAMHGLELANFLNMVQLEATGAEISATSLANEYKGFGTKVSVRDVVSTYVYANTLVVLSAKGSIIKQYLERCGAYFDLRDGEVCVSDEFLYPKEAHYNYDFFLGIDYTFDLSKPVGERVVSILKDGVMLDMNKNYKLVINNYRASGTGGYEFLKSCEIIKEELTEMTDLLISYIVSHEEIEIDTGCHINIMNE